MSNNKTIVFFVLASCEVISLIDWRCIFCYNEDMEKQIKKMFGDDYKEVIRTTRLNEILTDEETAAVFYELIGEIKKKNIETNELVEILKDLPTVLTTAIVVESFENPYEILSEMHEIYFEEFISACNKTNKSGVSDFEKRVKNTTLKNADLFLDKRLFTMEELYNIVEIFIKKYNKKYSYLYFFHRQNTEDHYEQILFNVHEMMRSSVKNDTIIEILNKNKKEILIQTLEKIKSINIGVDD